MKKYSFLDVLKWLFAWMFLLCFSPFPIVGVILGLIFPDNDWLAFVIYLILCLTIGCYMMINAKIAEFQERERATEIANSLDIKNLKKKIEELKKENEELKKENEELKKENEEFKSNKKLI